MRKHYNQEEVITIITDFKEYLKNNEALDTNKIGDKEFQDFLQMKKLEIKGIRLIETELKKDKEEEMTSQKEEEAEIETRDEEKDSLEKEQIKENSNEEEIE